MTYDAYIDWFAVMKAYGDLIINLNLPQLTLIEKVRKYKNSHIARKRLKFIKDGILMGTNSKNFVSYQLVQFDLAKFGIVVSVNNGFILVKNEGRNSYTIYDTYYQTAKDIKLKGNTSITADMLNSNGDVYYIKDYKDLCVIKYNTGDNILVAANFPNFNLGLVISSNWIIVPNMHKIFLINKEDYQKLLITSDKISNSMNIAWVNKKYICIDRWYNSQLLYDLTENKFLETPTAKVNFDYVYLPTGQILYYGDEQNNTPHQQLDLYFENPLTSSFIHIVINTQAYDESRIIVKNLYMAIIYQMPSHDQIDIYSFSEFCF